MAKPKRKARVAEVTNPPPQEQMDRAPFVRAGMAYRRVPAIDTLKATGKLTQRQYDALCRYRDVAIAEDRSPQRDSLDKALHGRSNGNGLPPALVRAASELKWLDGKLGALQPIARAIAVDDLTVSEWAMMRGGSVQRTRRMAARLVMCFEPRRSALRAAMEDIQAAADRLAEKIIRAA